MPSLLYCGLQHRHVHGCIGAVPPGCQHRLGPAPISRVAGLAGCGNVLARSERSHVGVSRDFGIDGQPERQRRAVAGNHRQHLQHLVIALRDDRRECAGAHGEQRDQRHCASGEPDSSEPVHKFRFDKKPGGLRVSGRQACWAGRSPCQGLMGNGSAVSSVASVRLLMSTGSLFSSVAISPSM